MTACCDGSFWALAVVPSIAEPERRIVVDSGRTPIGQKSRKAAVPRRIRVILRLSDGW